MLKVVLGTPGSTKKLLVLGLTPENLIRLTKGEPILVDGEAIGIPDLKIALTYGATLADIRKDLKDNLGVNMPHVPEPGPGEEFIVQTPPPFGG